MIIDVETGFANEFPLGLTGFISFKRLVLYLRKSGEIGDHETITHFKIEAHGISYVVKDIRP